MHKQLTLEQRYYIATARKNRQSMRGIAQDLKVSHSTISREVKRNIGKRGYRYNQTDVLAKQRHQNKNKYVIRAQISEVKFREIIRYFSLDLNAVQIKELTGLSRQTINKYLMAIRLRIVQLSQLQPPHPKGEVEVDESYFGARRVKGKRGRGPKVKRLFLVF